MEPMIYLFFNGNCHEAMRFYAETLGGEITFAMRNGDAPNPESRMPGGDELVMHMAMKLGNSMLMASDTPAEWYNMPQGFRVSISPTSAAEFDRIYAALGKDARDVAMAPGETFFSERFAMVTDRFGTPWMLNFVGSKAAG